jgi:predicted PolB exonuclease-like 3'-5' exonuclease
MNDLKIKDLEIGTEYLHISVYRNAEIGDCTNGGISSKVNKLILVSKKVEFERLENFCNLYNYDINTCVTVEDRGLYKGYLNLIPVTLVDSGQWTMFGGNFGYTSDSRFKNFITNYQKDGPVAIHDRVENY